MGIGVRFEKRENIFMITCMKLEEMIRVFALFCVSHEEGVRAGRSVQLNSLNAQPANNVGMATFTIKLSSIGRCSIRSENKKNSSILLKLHIKHLTATRNIIIMM